MNISDTNYPLPVSSALIQFLTKILNNSAINSQNTVVINFRDPTYSPESGGYHPVEIRLEKVGDWQISYITDFCYVGYGYEAELVKCLDFDFKGREFQDTTSLFPIELASEIYPIWESNFLYYAIVGDVFDIKISH